VDIVVDPEFERLIPPLSEQELRQLECSLLDDGALSPLVVWTPHNILLDGHHRLRLCRCHSIAFTTTGLEFESRDAARLWIIGHQLGRRNLPPEEVAYYRGQRYQEQRRDPAENLQKAQCFSSGHGVHSADVSPEEQPPKPSVNETEDKTARRLARAYNVTERTIRRDAQFAEALDALAGLFGVEFRSDVLAGATGLSKKDIITLAQMPREHLDAASQDWGSLHELAEMWRKRKQKPAPPAPAAEENPPAFVPGDDQECRDALLNILWVCGQKEETLDGLRGQLEQIAGIAREALGQHVDDAESEAATGAPLITDEDLL
jgi:hypothetical protein